jgi:hypothetical protein
MTNPDVAATVAKLKQIVKQIANDADAKKAEFANEGRDIDAAHYAGMRDGLLRAVSVVEGRG